MQQLSHGQVGVVRFVPLPLRPDIAVLSIGVGKYAIIRVVRKSIGRKEGSCEMSYTLSIEPDIVKEAESCAARNGTTLDAMIRACLLVFVSGGALNCGKAPFVWQDWSQEKVGLKIGSMKDEIHLPKNFDEVFDSMDEGVASMFNGETA